MGAENSRPNTQNQRIQREESTERAIAQALERQKRMYDEKYEELRRSQSADNQTPNNNNQQPTTPLYPNLNHINNNAQLSTAHTSPANNYAQTSTVYGSNSHNAHPPVHARFSSNTQMSTASPRTSNFQQPSNLISQPAFPTAPSAPIDPAFSSPTQFVNKPTPHREAHPRLTQSQTHPVVQTIQAVPSTSSVIEQPKPRSAVRKETPNIVKCVSCSDELGLQIFQCKNGHSSCRECRMRNTPCGLCRGYITDMRNITLEITIADLKLKELKEEEKQKCPNARDGCCLSFKKAEIEEHLKECPYREMACPVAEIYGNCTWKGKINHIGMHFKEEHPELYEADVDKEMHLFDINITHRIINLVNLGAFHFLVHLGIDSVEKTICMTVQTLGTKFSASKWMYELHVYNKREPRRKYQYIDTCISNSESVSDVFMQKKCAVLSSDYAKTFLFDNNQLAYKFYIKRNSNPKKNQQK